VIVISGQQFVIRGRQRAIRNCAIPRPTASARTLHQSSTTLLEKDRHMKDLKTHELTVITGGTRTNDLVTQQLTTLTTSIKDATNNSQNNSNSFLPFMMMALAMRPQQPTVVAAGPAYGPAYASGPIINVNARIGRRHWW
jgi:hypothetical protein